MHFDKLMNSFFHFKKVLRTFKNNSELFQIYIQNDRNQIFQIFNQKVLD